MKYPLQTVDTLALLVRHRPPVVFVQNPPSIAPLLVAVYAALTRSRFVVDAHSDAMMSPYWTRPLWLYRWLARRALATVVTNEEFAATIRSWGGRAIVIPDIPTHFPDGDFDVDGDFNVTVVNTFAADEPLEAVIAAARDVEDVTLYVTGDRERHAERIPGELPANVRFTGFLPESAYYGLLRSSQAVMCLTTRDHTMQRGACEALSLGQPIITSDWPLLREYFSSGTVHVDNTVDGIRSGLREMHRRIDDHRRGILELQELQAERWDAAFGSLLGLIEGVEVLAGSANGG